MTDTTQLRADLHKLAVAYQQAREACEISPAVVNLAQAVNASQHLTDALSKVMGNNPAALVEIFAPAGDGWLPIESAPRDRPIQVQRNGEQAVVSWMTSLEEGDGKWIIVRGRTEDGMPVVFSFRDPSHWRECPALPGAAP